MSFRNKGARVLLPFGLDYADISANGAPDSQKDILTLPINGDLNEMEHNIAQQSINITRLVSEGPFFTGKSQATSDNANSSDGIERHSDKYKKTQKIGRTIEEHPYQLEFFPEELYNVMGITGSHKKKLLSLSQYKTDSSFGELAATDEAQSILDKLKTMAEEVDEDGGKEEVEEEEDVDDEFDDDDDDDYNAEKYFDDGDDDGADGDDDEAAF